MPSSAERQSSVNRSTSQCPIPGPRLSGLWELKQTLKKNVTRGALSSGNLLPCPRASGLLLRTASAGLLSAYSENGMLVGDSRCNFRASAVVSSRLSRDSPWSCRTDDRGLEELASRISAMVFRGGGRCSCSHAGLAERYLYRRYVPAWSNLKAVASSSLSRASMYCTPLSKYRVLRTYVKRSSM